MKIAIVSPNSRESQLVLRLLRSQQYPVCWVAKTDTEAQAQAQAVPPEVVLLDLGVANCRELLKALRQEHGCEIVIISAALAREAAQAYAAVAAGAFDAVSLPGLDGKGQPVNLDAFMAPLVTLQKTLQKRQQSRGRFEPVAGPSPRQLEPRSRPQAPPKAVVPPSTVRSKAVPEPQTQPPAPDPAAMPPLVVMGASTGGPKAIATLLAALPADFPAAIVIVQHVNARFADRLSQWLQGHTKLAVKAAEVGMAPAAGQVFLAAEDRHLVMRANRTFGYRDQSAELYYCPSVDLFFDSVACHWREPGVAVLLTGMGRDGAVGLKALRDRGWLTVVQDEASASIHSMPKAAVELGAAMRELPPSQIAALLKRQYS